MHELQLIQIRKLTTLLGNIGGKYKIILPDGEELGTLECKPVKTIKSRGKLYVRGETSAYYAPIFKAAEAKIGDVVVIPFNGYDPVVLAGNVYSYAHGLWGNGNSTGRRDNAKGIIEVMRVG